MATATVIGVGLGAPGEAAPPTTRAGATTTTVQLVSGDTVLLRPGGQDIVRTPSSRHGATRRILTYRFGGHSYVIPAIAARYLDRTLDRRLFDVAELAKHAASPMHLSVTVPSSAPAVPGLTVTSRSATRREGYLTRDGAAQFGDALAKQWRADGSTHRTPTTLFGGVTHIAPVGSSTPVTPAFQQYVLRIKVTDAAGKPADFAIVSLTNVDDGRKFGGLFFVTGGEVRVSVPAGTYSGFAEWDDISTPGTDSYLMPVEEVPVSKDGQVFSFDARKATSAPSVHTPRPATLADGHLEWDRNTAHSRFAADSGFVPFMGVHVAPTPKVTKGKLYWVTNWALNGSVVSGTPYRYDLSFVDIGGVPADQHHSVVESRMARVDSHIYADDFPRTGYFGRSAYYAFQSGGTTTATPLAIPVARTEYVYGPASARWFAFTTGSDDTPGLLADVAPRPFVPGRSYSVEWGRGPLAPGVAEPAFDDTDYECNACRNADTLGLRFSDYSDTDPTHDGAYFLDSDDVAVTHFTLARDGKTIADVTNRSGAEVSVPAVSATYRAVETTDRAAVGYLQSARTEVDVTFVSSADDAGAVPDRWTCPDPDLQCTVLPILQAKVPLPTDLTGSMRQGTVPVDFTVDHIRHAAGAAISKVRFATSVAGGPYRDLPVTSLGGHRYRANLVNAAAAAGKPVSLRISAVDSAGGRLTETVDDAYLIAQS